MPKFDRIVILVLDSVGVGEMPDADAYGDSGSDTLGNLARVRGGVRLPNLGRLGLGNVEPVAGTPPEKAPAAAWGRCALAAPNKDTISGHWEMMGAVLDVPLPVFPKGFPQDLLEAVEKSTSVKGWLGNKASSGTEIIVELGDEHVRTGKPIVYTSADSVFQVAAHEERFGLKNLYDYCEKARAVLKGKWLIARVIARPFVGTSGAYARTANRHDYAVDPPCKTVLDELCAAKVPVLGIGKIQDIFNGYGVPENVKTKTNAHGVEVLLEEISRRPRGVLFANLVDFDMLYGHRNDVEGYARCLEEFDAALPRILGALCERDLLVVTSDHGNDPTTPSTDHSREFCLLLARAPGVHKAGRPGKALGDRGSLADIGATVAENFGVPSPAGVSFLGNL